LKNFSLGGAKGVSDAGLASLAKLSHLEELALGDLRNITPAGLAFLEALPELRQLALRVAADEQTVRSIGRLKKLERLSLWNAASDPLDLAGLGQLQALCEFRTNQQLTSDAIRALARIESLESIRDTLTEISDEDLQHLARLPKLRVLILDSDRITAASLPTLAKVHSLRELYVTDKVQITPAQWSSLGELSLSQCQIQQWFSPYAVYHAAKE
jgi:hypothetical protein